MPAWAVKQPWTSSMIQSYRHYVSTNGPSRSGVLRSTCEDLSIRMVVDFAERFLSYERDALASLLRATDVVDLDLPTYLEHAGTGFLGL